MIEELTAPVAGTVNAVAVPGERVAAGAAVVVIEAMKMEHEVVAESGGEVVRVDVAVGDTVAADQVVAAMAGRDEAADAAIGARGDAGRGERAEAVSGAGPAAAGTAAAGTALDAVRARHAAGLDAARPEAVAKRREQRAPDGTRERRRSRRRGHVRRVPAADLRRAGGAALDARS